MEISVKTGDVLTEPADLAALGLFEDEALPETVAGWIAPGDFSGKAGQNVLLYSRGDASPARVLLLGLGRRSALTTEGLRQATATAIQQGRTLQAASVTIGLQGEWPIGATVAAQAIAEGVVLGQYRFLRYRTDLSREQTHEVSHVALLTGDADAAAARAGVDVGRAIAQGANYARDLVNTPGYALTPAALAGEAQALGERTALKVTVLDKAQLIEGGYGGILAVGQGSVNDPRFIIIEHGEAKAGVPTVCLVGKGLTFDSGGLSLKPAEFMTTMKSDMGGGAAVLGAMHVVTALDLPLHVVGLVPAAENMPGANALRPDDVVTSLSGKTIEVLNTDAEGRIVLADALHYALRYKPDAIIELSTLTGAMVIALGAHATGVMGTNEALVEQLRKAGEATGERVWPFPLWDEYKQMLKSEVADLKNIGGRPAGSITAGAFLAAFTGDVPFAHLDIAGTAFSERPAKPYHAPGATGVGVRLLVDLLRQYAPIQSVKS